MSRSSKKDNRRRFLSFGSLFKFLIIILPAVLFFSYEPVIMLGASESMNFELSLPLIWLVVFDILVTIMMVREKKPMADSRKKWVWLVFPVWLTLSVLWSLNIVRGVLTVGIVWLLYLAVDGMWQFRSAFDEVFRRRFWKWFFASALIACGVCWAQCILDLAKVAREWSLICAGCTYHMFGFPHPDGFAIEPQFMGNLLLAPALAVAWMIICGKNRNNIPILLGVISFTLFLTFSRGAIYAFFVGLVVMCMWIVVQAKKRNVVMKRVGLTWGIVILSFVVAVNVQGLMAEFSPTNDTYVTGVSKVLDQLSLGIIDIDGETVTNQASEEVDDVEKPVENSGENTKEEAAFDGYVAESTNTRLRLFGAAVKVWSQGPATVMFGVGLGGAGQALYNNGLSPAPKEIVQNQYASLLLETGLAGVILAILSLIMMIRWLKPQENSTLVISLMIAYGVSLLFFSGLPNALQIYLLPMLLALMPIGYTNQ